MKRYQAPSRSPFAAIARWLGRWVPLGMVSLLPTIASFLGNRAQVSIQDLVLPVILDLLTAAVVMIVFYRLRRRRPLVGYLAAITMVLILTSGYEDRLSSISPVFQALLPFANLGGLAPRVFSAVFLALIAGLAYGVGLGVFRLVRWRKWSESDVCTALSIAIVATFVLQAFSLAKDLIVEWPQFFYKPPKLTATTPATTAAGKPDIYYIVLDRYTSPDVLKAQFGFDNSDFWQYLAANQYFVNPSAHNNYPYTTMSIAATMDANYQNDIIKRFGGSTEQTVIPFNESIRNSPVAGALKSLGYNYDLVGNWYETSNLSGLADASYQQTGQLTLFGWHVTLNNFSKNILTQAPIWRFIQNGISFRGWQIFNYTNQSDIDMTHYALDSLRKIAAQPAGGKFVYAHILVPHDPYYFNADGSLNPNTESDNVGESVKQKYLGQVQYINSQMKDILTRIQNQSHGQAVVVLQADEGPYPFQLNDENFDSSSVLSELAVGDMRQWPNLDLQLKYGNLAAYHVPAAGATVNADTADSVNIFRLIFNTYFGTELPYLPHCYYAYPNGRDQPIRFTDITARLSGAAADPRCLANGTVAP